MVLQALLYSNDGELVSVFDQALTSLKIESLHLDDPLRFLDLLANEHFDLLVVDWDGTEHGLDVLAQARQHSANRDAIVMLATTERDPTRFLERGANLILYKPLTLQALERHLRSAHMLMQDERRRYNRYPVRLPVSVRMPDGRQVLGNGYSLREGGIALEFPERVNTDDLLQVEFVLPKEDLAMQLTGKLAWVNSDLHTGIRFVQLRNEAREQLRGWLERNAPSPAA
ncbi:MAG TPA: PilZ domain-containing protein [Terriglobales bacterium]|nr:PilZ domain-containing protein [Terriglobales bacterium]